MMLTPTPPEYIGGMYKLVHLLGRGGMGEVYAAIGPGGERVAVKILHESARQDPDLVTRFEREAEVASRIHSPYVARILGAGKDPSGKLWIAFEQLQGEGLDDRLLRENALSFWDVAPILDDVLQGLMAAHEAHVIHRDIKPANLFLEKREPNPLERAQNPYLTHVECTRILDFGISKYKPNTREHNEPSLTAFDATLGSFAYMAPEQIRGAARVDLRADLYAVGAVAFRMLAGRLPFEGQNPLALVALKLNKEPPGLFSITGEKWPGQIERFLSKLMAKNRDDRFNSAEETLFVWRSICKAMNGSVPPSGHFRTSHPDYGSDHDEPTSVTFVPKNKS